MKNNKTQPVEEKFMHGGSSADTGINLIAHGLDDVEAKLPDGSEPVEDFGEDSDVQPVAYTEPVEDSAEAPRTDFAQIPCTPENFGVVPAAQFDEVYAALIQADVHAAQANLEALPENDRRGLTMTTLRHFNCGYLPDWVLTKTRAEFLCGLYVGKETGKRKRLPQPSPRIIVPTSDKHFNGVATDSVRHPTNKDFWKQHAGKKEMFNATDALKHDLIVVVEGEIDAMSIWQATQGVVGVVAILGCGNGRKSLLPYVDDLRGKKLLLLLDADEAGKNAAKKFLDEISELGLLAVNRTLYDAMHAADQKEFGCRPKEVDANSLLVHYGNPDKKFGNAYLRALVERIIEDAEPDFDKRQKEIEEIIRERQEQAALPVPDLSALKVSSRASSASKTSTENRRADVSKLPREEFDLILRDYVHARDLNRDDWLNVGRIMRDNGFTVEDFKRWSNDGDRRYNETTCEREWKDFHASADVNGKPVTVATLIYLAKQRGYQPKKNACRPTNDESARADVASVFADNEDLRGRLSDWQELNGTINPDVLPKIKAAAEYLDSLTPENFTPADARDYERLKKVALCVYYLPTIGENFFAIAHATQKRARAAIKRLEKKKPPKKPSRRVLELSEIAVTPIRKAVEPLVKLVKDTHVDYRRDIEAKRLAAQWEVQEQKIRANNEAREQERIANTTAKLISDCPVDLILPPGVMFDDKKGISRFDWDKPPKFRVSVATCATPMVPTAIYREPGKHTTAYEVAIKSKGFWRRVKVNGDELADSKKILRLARDGGALIESSQHLCKYFAQIIKENEDRLPEIKCYAQPGWTDKTFSTFAYPTGGEGYIVRRTGFDFEGEFGTAGDADEWKKYFLDACQRGGAAARIFLGTALAAPLVRPLVVLNSQCHLDGRNNNGKTALNKLGASIYGNPLKLMRTFAATQKNLQSVAAACRDLPAFIDELETANKKMLDDLPTMIYDFAQGKTNQANKRNGDMREALEFSGTRLTTAERPLLKKQDQRGAFKRLVQIHCDTLFDEDFGTDLHYVTENNYGHFGRPWVEFVTAHLKEIKEVYRDIFKLAAARKMPVEKTLLKSVVAASVALQYFLICGGAKNSFDDKTAAEDIVAIVATLPTPADMDESTRALDDLRGRFAEKIKYFTREGDNSPGDASTFRDSGGDPPAATYDTYGKIFKNGEVAILPTVLRRWIENDLGYASLEPIVADWAKKELLVVGNDKGAGMRCRIRINGNRQWVYKFNANVMHESNEVEI